MDRSVPFHRSLPLAGGNAPVTFVEWPRDSGSPGGPTDVVGTSPESDGEAVLLCTLHRAGLVVRTLVSRYASMLLSVILSTIQPQLMWSLQAPRPVTRPSDRDFGLLPPMVLKLGLRSPKLDRSSISFVHGH